MIEISFTSENSITDLHFSEKPPENVKTAS